MNLQFTHPNWLWLLPAVWAWVAWLAWKSDVQTGPVRRWAACTIRLVVTGAMVLALAGLQWLTPVEGMNIMFVLDRSDSVGSAGRDEARAWVQRVAKQKPPEDRAGVVVFGSDASIESSAAISLNFDKIEAIVDGERTDIGGALRLASAAFPEFGQRRIVLLTDGNENAGDALGVAAAARAMEVDVTVVPLAGEARVDVSIERFRLPSSVRLGQTFEAEVIVQADEPGPATLRLYRNDLYLGEQTVRLEAGKNRFTFPQTLPESGFYSYEAWIDSPRDEMPRNNRATAITQIRGLPRVLMISSEPAADRPLANALESPELELRLAGVESFPGSLGELQSYDALMLCNVSAAELPRHQQELIEAAVRDFGMGLVCVGGDQTYAAGAYRGTPLARILPLEVELSSKKALPPGALALVIDRSGSMMGEKLNMARQGAAAAVEALGATDYAGVIAFDGGPQIVAQMQRVGDREALIRGILGIGSGGGTVMHPAIQQAHEMLRGVTASFKHCIVLTDGASVPGDFEGLIREMVEDRITVSTIGIGTDVDTRLLESIAALGKGRFYPVPHPGQLPRVFIKETVVVLKTAIDEEPFVPQLAVATEPVRGLASYPPLLGHVVTERRDRAETPLLTQKGDPLLAHWHYGLGRVVAFTSDARAKWGSQWLAWDGYQQFWRQTLLWSLRRLEQREFNVEMSMEGGQGRVNVDAVDDRGNFRNFLELEGSITGPDGQRQAVRLRQTGAGRYEADFETKAPGAYLLSLVEMENGTPRASHVVGASLNYSPEYRSAEPNMNLLRRIAEITGGTLLDPQASGVNPFQEDRRRTWRPHDLWEWLLKFAILLFVLDVGVRRVNPDLVQLRSWASAAVRKMLFWRNSAAPSVESVETLASLRARRQAARPVSTPAPIYARESAANRPPASVQPKIASPPPAQPEREQAPPSRPEEPASTASRLLEAKRKARESTRRG